MPTIPAPMMALTKLDVAPATDDLCSLALVDSFLILRVVPPGVEIWMSLRGVDGAKKGDAGGFMPLLPPLLLPPFAMVGRWFLATDLLGEKMRGGEWRCVS